MEEKNKHSLKKAINNLPKYKPSDQLWDKLSDDLPYTEANTPLQDAIQNLPTHTAPDHIWANIEKQLPAPKKRVWLRVMAAAATVALLVGLAWTSFQNNFEQEIVNITHSEEEVIPARFVQINHNSAAQRDSAFKTIVRAQKKSDEDAKQILAELEMLDASKKRLQRKLSPYDINKVLEEKLNRIEEESIELQQAYLATI